MHDHVACQAEQNVIIDFYEIERTETCIDLEECLNISPTTGAHDDRRSEPRLFDAPTSLNTERTTSIRFRAAVATTEGESGPFFTDLEFMCPAACARKTVQKRSIKTLFFSKMKKLHVNLCYKNTQKRDLEVN